MVCSVNWTSEKPITGCGRCPCGQARPSSEARATNSRLLWYLPPREVSLTPRTWARAWTASCSMVCRVWQEPSARHSPETNSSGRRQAQSGAWALFGGVAFDPVVGAEVAPFGVDVQGAGGEAGAGDDHDLGQL